MIVLRQDCCPCLGDAEDRNPCKKKLRIDYQWCGCSDLDTHTEYNGDAVGWACENYGNFLNWVTGDDTSSCGMESVEVELPDGNATAYITCSAKWFADCGDESFDRSCLDFSNTNCPITIKVSSCGKTATKVVHTSAMSRECASGNTLAVIEIYPDSSFEIL